jgi:uncharacterized membrane protein YdcZ (DUF606 family)
MIGVWMVIAIAIGITITFNPSINQDFIKTMSDACITVSSIFLASILAIFAIISTKSKKRIPVEVTTLPIFGIITSLFSLYFVYLENYLSTARGLIALSMELTIGSFLAITLLLNYEDFFQEYSIQDNIKGKIN